MGASRLSAAAAAFERSRNNSGIERDKQIEAGNFADIVATAGDPAADVGELQKVKFVMKDGEVVRNDLSAQPGGR